MMRLPSARRLGAAAFVALTALPTTGLAQSRYATTPGFAGLPWGIDSATIVAKLGEPYQQLYPAGAVTVFTYLDTIVGAPGSKQLYLTPDRRLAGGRYRLSAKGLPNCSERWDSLVAWISTFVPALPRHTLKVDNVEMTPGMSCNAAAWERGITYETDWGDTAHPAIIATFNLPPDTLQIRVRWWTDQAENALAEAIRQDSVKGRIWLYTASRTPVRSGPSQKFPITRVLPNATLIWLDHDHTGTWRPVYLLEEAPEAAGWINSDSLHMHFTPACLRSEAAYRKANGICPSYGAKGRGDGRVLAGTWTGSYMGEQGLAGATLKLAGDIDGSVTGTLELYPTASNPLVTRDTIALEGVYRRSHDIRLKGWVHKGDRLEPLALAALLAPDRVRLIGVNPVLQTKFAFRRAP